MRALMHGVCAVVLSCTACASAPAPHSVADVAEIDSLGALWGDEYDGAPVDLGEPVRTRRGFSAEWVEGDTRSARADAFSNGASVRVRSTHAGDSGSLSWHGTGVVRELSVGHVSPVIAEGALAGDPRTSSDLRASATVRGEGLRMQTTARDDVAGAGVVLAGDRMRLALAACQSADDPENRAGFASMEHRAGGATVGIAGGVAIRDTSPRGGASLYAARENDASFISGEVAAAGERVRAIARAVVGERREWSAIAIAGAGPANEEPLVFTPRQRWGAALERRDGWAWGASRTGLSSLTRRDADRDVQRRRVFWDGEWRIRDDTRLELGARVTREHSERVADGVLAALPGRETHDDWRARATLRAERASDTGWIVDNAYRLEFVQNRSGRPGTIATWTCRLRAGSFDGRFSASAHALYRGQVAYTPEPAPLASGEFASLSGRGAAMSGSLRVWLRGHAWLGAAWSKRPPSESRAWITLGVRT